MRDWLCAALAGAIAVSAFSARGETSADSDAEWIEAITQSETDLELAFPIPGVVSGVLVEPGQRVERGQVLAKLDDREIAASVALLRIRAESDLAIREALALLDLARNELARVDEAHTRGAVSGFEVERASLGVTRREVALELARQRQAEARLQLEQSEATRDRYLVRAPLDGVVEEVLIDQGETVEELRPVVRVVSVDPLRIDVAAPLEATIGVEVGGLADVAWDRGGGQIVEIGRVVHVASVADAGSGTRLVRVRLANPGRAPAGARVRVRLHDPR